MYITHSLHYITTRIIVMKKYVIRLKAYHAYLKKNMDENDPLAE